jgi:predicted aldo/keto reductase-like oxidoreductase
MVKIVELGRTGLRVSEIAFGTGTGGWGGSSEQTRIGYENLITLMKFAYGQGITFWDSADQYGTHKHLAEVLEGIDRSTVTITTKTTSRGYKETGKDIKRFLKEIGTDYLDIVLLHDMTESDWNKRYSGAVDALSEAKKEGLVRALGISCHSFNALKTVADSQWVDVLLVRINRYGKNMDASVKEVVPVLKKIHAAGKGIYAMKVFGRGSLIESKRQCMEYVLNLDCIDAMTIGMKSKVELLENLSLLSQTYSTPSFR